MVVLVVLHVVEGRHVVEVVVAGGGDVEVAGWGLWLLLEAWKVGLVEGGSPFVTVLKWK